MNLEQQYRQQLLLESRSLLIVEQPAPVDADTPAAEDTSADEMEA